MLCLPCTGRHGESWMMAEGTTDPTKSPTCNCPCHQGAVVIHVVPCCDGVAPTSRPVREVVRLWRFLGAVFALFVVGMWWMLWRIAATGSGGIGSVSFGFSDADIAVILAGIVFLCVWGPYEWWRRRSAARASRD